MTSFGDDRQTNDALRTLEFSERVDRQTSDALRTLDLSERVDRQTNDALSTRAEKVHLFRILLIEFFQGVCEGTAEHDLVLAGTKHRHRTMRRTSGTLLKYIKYNQKHRKANRELPETSQSESMP